MVDVDRSAQGAARQSYATILRSSAIMGASFAIVMVFSFARMKVMALLVGPSGVGLLGVLSTVLDLTVAIAGLGVAQSGIRQIAAAGDDDARATTARAIQWLSLGLGLLGTAALVVMALPVSHLTFGTEHYAGAISLVAIAVLLRVLGGGRLAVLQGTRQISTMARINVLAAFLSTAVSIPAIYFWREQAIAPLIVIMAGITTAVTWGMGKRIVSPTPHPLPQVNAESRALVHLGVVFMASMLLTTGAAYLARIIILHQAGIEGAGFYQAAWAVGVLYSGFILQAMGSDFYPRLSGLANNDAAANRLVNEQMLVSILLAAPGVLGTITFAQVVMHLFYAAEFEVAADTLRWISLGTFLQTLAWPAGFILLAKGARRPFFWLEAAAAAVQVGLTVILVPIYGHQGAGMAFCLMYLSHTLLVTWLANRASGFAWSDANIWISLGFLALIVAVFAGFQLLAASTAIWLGLAATVLAGCLSLGALIQLVPTESVPSILRPLNGLLVGRAR
jgi:antigen flippase